jgi:hypothetical protein
VVVCEIVSNLQADVRFGPLDPVLDGLELSVDITQQSDSDRRHRYDPIPHRIGGMEVFVMRLLAVIVLAIVMAMISYSADAQGSRWNRGSRPGMQQSGQGTPWVRPGTRPTQTIQQPYVVETPPMHYVVIPLNRISPELAAYIFGGEVIYGDEMGGGSRYIPQWYRREYLPPRPQRSHRSPWRSKRYPPRQRPVRRPSVLLRSIHPHS